MSMELLAPAGGPASLRAAVQSGADAVYLGADAFGARYGAENFKLDELGRWVDYCHLYGVDVHVTVNTLVKNKELGELKNYVRRLAEARADAFIVQDIGAAEVIKSILPDMTLHASTQMTVTSLEGVRYLEKMGFSRVVLARELSENEIRHICENAQAEIEVFVHGAVCMSYSGQCLMSSILGGRSGNRGRCAQPCRLPYELMENGKAVGQGCLLSPKDMALVNELGTLNKIGVKSLKIEGRLKRAEYVSAVVGIYRKYIDNPRRITEDDIRELTDAFSRTGFTDGYFKGKLGRNMMSHNFSGNSAENKFTPEAVMRTLENANIRKIPVSITGTLKLNRPLEISMRDADGNCVNTAGTLNAEKAVNKPLDEERLCSQLAKLGSTPFECENPKVSVQDGVTVPIKEINALRRMSSDELIKKRCERSIGRIRDCELLTHCERKTEEIVLTAEVSDEKQLEASVNGGIKRIYVPADVLGTLKDKTVLRIAEKNNTELVTKLSDIFCEENIVTDAVLAPSAASIYRYGGKKMYGDFRLNIFNSRTAEHFSYLDGITLSPELNIYEIEDLLRYTKAKAEVIGYGRLPLMIMRNCPVKAMNKCQRGKRVYTLRDRKNEEFPVMCGKNCRAVLLNSKPVFTADKIGDLTNLKINSLRLIFTVENFSQCGKIIDVYKRALSGEKVRALPENTFTRGHLYRGVL